MAGTRDRDEVAREALGLLAQGYRRVQDTRTIDERIREAKERFSALTKYEVLADLDDLRRNATRGEVETEDGRTVAFKVNAKAVLDISKFLLEHVEKREADERRLGGNRQSILDEQRRRGVGKAAKQGAN